MSKHSKNEVLADTLDSSKQWSPLRWSLIVASAILALLPLIYLIWFGLMTNPKPKPTEIYVPSILFIGLGALAVMAVPWDEIGLVPTAFLGVKLKALNRQKMEQIDAIVPIQEQMRELQAKYDELSRIVAGLTPEPLAHPRNKKAFVGLEQIAEITSSEKAIDTSSEGVLDQVLRFLKRYRGSFFNPIRIQRLASEQKEFSSLGSCSVEEIREALYRGVSENGVKVQISQKGTTLYGYSKWSKD